METIVLALVATVVPIYTLYINYRKDKTIASQTSIIEDQARTINRLTLELDGLPKRVAEQMANNLLLTEVTSNLRAQLVEAGVSLEDQPAAAIVSPFSPLTPAAEELVDDVLDEQNPS